MAREKEPTITVSPYAEHVKISGSLKLHMPYKVKYGSIEIYSHITKEYGPDVDMEEAMNEVADYTVKNWDNILEKYKARPKNPL